MRRAATFLRKIGIEIGFDREGRARTRTIRLTATHHFEARRSRGATVRIVCIVRTRHEIQRRQWLRTDAHADGWRGRGESMRTVGRTMRTLADVDRPH